MIHDPTKRPESASDLGKRHTRVVETMGLEPTTSCLQSRRSSRLSYVPRQYKTTWTQALRVLCNMLAEKGS